MTEHPEHPEQPAESPNQESAAPTPEELAAEVIAEAEAVAQAAADTEALNTEALEAEATDTAAEEAEAATLPEPSSIEAQLAERTEDLQRVTAEYANFRRRTERDRSQVVTTAKAEVITELLPIVDDLKLAETHGDLTGPLKAVADKLASTFTKFKVEEFGAPGEEFDPARHEAVQDLSSGDAKVIGTVLRAGFAMQDRLIRTAMVIINDPETDPSAE